MPGNYRADCKGGLQPGLHAVDLKPGTRLICSRNEITESTIRFQGILRRPDFRGLQ
jgi:hypothetical protein